MDRSTQIKLISVSYQTDVYGVQRATETKTTIYASVESVTMSELAEGGRLGLNPELRFTIFAPEYGDQQVIQYNGKRYGVYRTFYGKNDTLELYCERKGGDNV